MTDRADNAYEQWRRERPDIDPFPMQVLGRLFEAAQRLERDHLNPLFTRFGLRPGEFDVLATLRRSGAPYALTPTQLYEALMMSSGGMTNRIDRLEQAQWVARQSNPQDRRGTLVTLTEQGRELMDTLVALHTDNERQALASLNEDEQQQLNLLLKKLLAGLPQP
ncbi:MarR family winged helix-turn-helix transcriptional regulator [Dickeya dadantii]|uniref:Transcriptional regulator, MarR family n=1 Tax=Dickeya dadantii (strain 3937) TaxID=198628 RepID=E0SL41_DICD3|nr:MarR family transcriptional regulator [Dickeya dadantii]ADM98076.1 Transcriptional regulator, MarR family [Dickeya dadantii 3937]MCL6406405.1 MarR family transcriptional regulator [Dickeya dadantii]NAT78643.1 MarR family transcriptional regulator [Dickeya dadantii]NPE53522.1 MarR family transcriptional regulator [Dickeya dadantii]NPE64851.1 MarR family transcriptional regulator [Dickeya dadantii]